jgi:hypothetical protein
MILEGEIRMNKHILAVAIAVVAMSAVLATAVTTASLGATAAQTPTRLSLSISKTTVYPGDSVTGSGQLVDANGRGIPNQVIHFKYQSASFSGHRDTQTDASGNYGQTMSVPSSGLPSSQLTLQITAAYDGNAQYAASQSAPVTVTLRP